MSYIGSVQAMGCRNNLVLVTKATNASSCDKKSQMFKLDPMQHLWRHLPQLWISLSKGFVDNGFLDGYTYVGVDNKIFIEPFEEMRVRDAIVNGI